MGAKEIKELLQKYLWIKKNIDYLEDELLVIESRITKVTPTLSDLPKASGRCDNLADCINDIIEIKNQINSKLPELYSLRVEIEDLIDKLPERERYLVMARYIHAKKWEEIAVDMCYNWKYIHELHSKALNLMSEYKTSD